MSTKPRTVTRTTAKTKAQPAQATAPSRTTRTANSKNTTTSTFPEPTAKKTASRKPFAVRDNSPEGKGYGFGSHPQPTKAPAKSTLTKASSMMSIYDDGEREPIQAFLRIRPQLGDDDTQTQSSPYLDHISSSAVRMTDPSSSHSSPRLSTLPSSIYTFSHVFPSSTPQSEFFQRTTLPLVKDVLSGQSALLFAYGVTNSGKTYSIQGGSEKGSAGILPRTLDVIFNSIEGQQGDGRFVPVRLQGIEAASSTSLDYYPPSTPHVAGTALADVLLDLPDTDPDMDPTTLKLDKNHEYTIWLSYAEIYNEKVYDLFASVDDPSTPSHTQSQRSQSGIPRPTSTFLNTPLPSSQSKPLLLTRKALPVKPCPPSDSDDDTNVGKYVAGLRQLRVTSADQAKALLRLGQMHRQVFGTLANSQSSRSHAMVTIKVLKVHRGERNDPTSIQTSRLTLVDLAGSERTRNTHTSGDRLREAGNINKSLMVLGQCMETMRANQRTLARSLETSVINDSGRLDTRDVRKGLAIVPFRHSKLTEVLMDYFAGEGRVAMIVNVNPYDTGYDENSHVMKFSALAREVCTTAPVAVSRAVPVAPSSSLPRSKSGLTGNRASDVVPHRRKVTISTGGPGHAINETTLEVLEEDEEPDDEEYDVDDEPINPLVDALFDEIETLRLQLFETELRCAAIEADTREEVVVEMEARMRKMEKMYNNRMMQELEQHESKMDAKIDMLHRSGMLGRNSVANKPPSRMSTETVEVSSEEEEGDDLEDITEEDEDEKSSELSRSPSPLEAKRARMNAISSSHEDRYSKYHEDAQDRNMESEDEIEPASSVLAHGAEDEEESDEIEEWPSQSQSFSSQKTEPEPVYPVLKAKERAPTRGSFRISGSSSMSSIDSGNSRKSSRPTRSSSLAQIVEKTGAMTLDDDPDESVVIIPNRKARQEAVKHAGANAEYVPQKGESDTMKKKKRQLNKNPVFTEDDLERAVTTSSSQESNASGKSVGLRRSTRGNNRP